MSVLFSIKRGDTYLLDAQVSVDGTAKDMAGWTLRSQIRRNKVLVAECTVAWLDQVAGKYRLTVPAGTAGWPVDTLRQDIQYVSPAGQVVSTETFMFQVIEDVTQ